MCWNSIVLLAIRRGNHCSVFMSDSSFVILWHGECASVIWLGPSLIALSNQVDLRRIQRTSLHRSFARQKTLHSDNVQQHTNELKHGYSRYHSFALRLSTTALPIEYSALPQLQVACSATSPQCSAVRSAMSTHRPKVSPATSLQCSTAFSTSVILEVRERGSGYPALQTSFPAMIDNVTPTNRYRIRSKIRRFQEVGANLGCVPFSLPAGQRCNG